MILTRIFPGDSDFPGSGFPGNQRIDLQDADARDRLAILYAPPRPDWLRLNLITSVSGSVAGSDGTSESLTNRADRAILGVIRGQADVVLVGAETVRAEGYQLPRKSRLAILTGSGNLAGHRVGPDVGPGRVLVICPASAVDAVTSSLGDLEPEIVVIADEAGRLPVRRAVTALAERGLTSIVCEGGPSLAAQLLDEDLVDELCLSTSPIVTSTHLPLFGDSVRAEHRLKLSLVLVDDAGALYARWSLPERPAAG